MEAQSVCGQKTRCSFHTTQPFSHAYSFWVSKRMSEISKILRAVWCTVSQWWHHILLLYMQGIWTRLSTVQQSWCNFATHLTVYTTTCPVQLLWITAKKDGVNCPLQQCFASCSQVKILHIDGRLLAQFSPWKRSCSGHSSGCFVRSILTSKSSHITMYVNSLVPSLSPSLCYRSLGMRLLHQYNTQVKQKSR